MGVFDKATIESFANEVDTEVVDTNFSKLEELLFNATDSIAKRNAVVGRDFKIIPVNEFANGAITPSSTLCVFLALNSPQLELNTTKLAKNKLKTIWNRVKSAWDRARLSKRKKKKLKKLQNVNSDLNLVRGKYNLSNFCYDLVNLISERITNLSIVSTNNCILEIVGDDFGFPVRIYPVISKGNYFLFYKKFENKFIKINFKNRFYNMSEKFTDKEQGFLDLLRIYNMLYYNIYLESANQLFMESLLYNLPDVCFENDAYTNFINSINYFNNASWGEFVSILDKDVQLFKDKGIKVGLYQILDFIKNIKKNMEE